jgi:hypothetical protein
MRARAIRRVRRAAKKVVKAERKTVFMSLTECCRMTRELVSFASVGVIAPSCAPGRLRKREVRSKDCSRTMLRQVQYARFVAVLVRRTGIIELGITP